MRLGRGPMGQRPQIAIPWKHSRPPPPNQHECPIMDNTTSQLPVGQSMLRRPGELTWSSYSSSTIVHGPTALSGEHVIQTDPRNGRQYAYPAERIPEHLRAS